MRIAEYLNMPEEPVVACMNEFAELVEGEGETTYNLEGDTGGGLLFDEAQHMIFRGLQDQMSITLILSIIVAKAFRLGCMYGRRVVAPEDRE